MSEPDDVLETLVGAGQIAAEGLRAVRVRYALVVTRLDAQVLARGTLTGNPQALRPIWLTPDATLRLKDGRCLAVSVTDLDGDTATFESSAPITEGWP